MPKELQKFATEYGDFWIEVEIPEGRDNQDQTQSKRGLRDISVTQDADLARLRGNQSFEIPVDFGLSLEGIMPMIKKIRDLASSVQLKGVEIELGAKFAKKVNLFVVSGGADVDFKIKFKWEIEKGKSSDEPSGV
jgi:hypothetical protein